MHVLVVRANEVRTFDHIVCVACSPGITTTVTRPLPAHSIHCRTPAAETTWATQTGADAATTAGRAFGVLTSPAASLGPGRAVADGSAVRISAAVTAAAPIAVARLRLLCRAGVPRIPSR